MAQVTHASGCKAWTTLAPSGGAIPMWNGLVASNQTISCGLDGRGDMLYATAGYITRNTETIDKLPLGIAQTKVAASSGVHVSMLFIPAVPWVVFTGMASASFTQGYIWAPGSITGAVGVQVVGLQTGSKSIWMIGKDPNSSFGSYADVLFIFNQSKFCGTELDTSNTLAG